MRLVDYAALFMWSFLAATVIPLGSEPALALIARRDATIGLAVFIATTGNYLGACTTYYLASRAGAALGKGKPHPRLERAGSLVRRYGSPALLLSWVPLIGDAIVAAAGAARIDFTRFSLWTILGKAARYIVVALVARELF